MKTQICKSTHSALREPAASISPLPEIMTPPRLLQRTGREARTSARRLNAVFASAIDPYRGDFFPVIILFTFGHL